MKVSKSLHWMSLGLAGLVVLLVPLPLFSQSCALCYTQAASAGSRMIAALKSGILILVVPPTFLSVLMIFVLQRKNHQVRRPEFNNESGRDW
jgi:hypothetical protein